MILPFYFHSPVLLTQVISYLKIKPGKKYIDATLGSGGYSLEILKRGGSVLGIDLDDEAIIFAKDRLSTLNKYQDKHHFVKGNYRYYERADIEVGEIAKKLNFKPISGIVLDLGLSTYQLESSKRGFTFKKDEPLDMRFDKDSKLTAEKVINSYPKEALYEIFTAFSEELDSRTIAEAIIRARSLKEIKTTKQLVSIIEKSQKRTHSDLSVRKGRKVITRIFQALRIEVNDELENIQKGISEAIKILLCKGRLIVISYHSLEDRIVKLKFRENEKKGLIRRVTKKSIRANFKEVKNNPKSKWAKLRIAEKIYAEK